MCLKCKSNALFAETQRSAREVERLTEHKEQIENILIVSLDKVSYDLVHYLLSNKVSLETRFLKKTVSNKFCSLVHD